LAADARRVRTQKKVAGITEDSLYEVALTLRNFERLVGQCNSKQITQNTIDKFILERGKEVKRSTLNKDIRNLITFINWCRENRYLNGEIRIKKLKEDERPVQSLNSSQIKELLSASKPYQTLRMRILLALGTGLRRGDIESLRISDIDFENCYVTTRSKKTRKSMGSRPVPVRIMEELKKYVSVLKPDQEKIFIDRFNQYRWDQIRKKLGLGDFKFHDLRKVFCSVLAQNGVSTAVTQKLLEHSSSDLTNKVYTNVDPVLRHAVEQIPVGDWRKGGDGWYLGPFAKIGPGGKVKNLVLENLSIDSGNQSFYLGGLCGYNEGGTIINCSCKAVVKTGTGSSYIGGLCGENDQGTITNCYSQGSVVGRPMPKEQESVIYNLLQLPKTGIFGRLLLRKK
jgi:integrase